MVLTLTYDDWAVVVVNLREVWKGWMQMAWIMGREGETCGSPAVIQHRVPVLPVVRVRDVGPNSPNGMEPQGLPLQGGPLSYS